MIPLGKKIHLLRILEGLSQTKKAAELGIAQTSLSLCEQVRPTTLNTKKQVFETYAHHDDPRVRALHEYLSNIPHENFDPCSQAS